MVDIGIIKIGYIPVNIFLVISRLQIISKKEVEIENPFGTKADLSAYRVITAIDDTQIDVVAHIEIIASLCPDIHSPPISATEAQTQSQRERYLGIGRKGIFRIDFIDFGIAFFFKKLTAPVLPKFIND